MQTGDGDMGKSVEGGANAVQELVKSATSTAEPGDLITALEAIGACNYCLANATFSLGLVCPWVTLSVCSPFSQQPHGLVSSILSRKGRSRTSPFGESQCRAYYVWPRVHIHAA